MNNKLRIILLYSQQDVKWQQGILPYLQALESTDLVLPLRSFPIEEITEYELLNQLDRADMVLLLNSMHLLLNKVWRGAAKRRVQEYHKTKRLLAICIPLHEVDADANFLQKVTISPSNKKTIVGDFWAEPELAYQRILNELKGYCDKFYSRKKRLEELWRDVQHQNKAEHYDGFLDTYPYSKYSRRARQKRDDLVEKKLWCDANHGFNKGNLEEEIEGDTVLSYLEYLRETRLKLYWQHAIERIAALELHEDQNWAQAREVHHLTAYYQFKTNFAKSLHIKETDEHIDRALRAKSFAKPIDGYDMNISHLFYTTLDELDTEEAFGVLTSLDYLASLKENLQKVGDRLQSYITSWFSLSIFLFAFLGTIVLFANLVNQPISLPWGTNLKGHIFWGFVWSMLVFWYFITPFIILEDIKIVKRAIKSCKYMNVAVQVAIIMHEYGYNVHLLQFTQKAEKVVKRIRRHSFGYYLIKFPTFENKKDVTWKPPIP